MPCSPTFQGIFTRRRIMQRLPCGVNRLAPPMRRQNIASLAISNIDLTPRAPISPSPQAGSDASPTTLLSRMEPQTDQPHRSQSGVRGLEKPPARSFRRCPRALTLRPRSHPSHTRCRAWLALPDGNVASGVAVGAEQVFALLAAAPAAAAEPIVRNEDDQVLAS